MISENVIEIARFKTITDILLKEELITLEEYTKIFLAIDREYLQNNDKE